MKETIKLGFILFLVAAISGGVLAAINQVTKPIVDERADKEMQEAFKEIIPEAKGFENLDKTKLEEIQKNNTNILDINVAKLDGDKNAYVIKSKGPGYGGDVIVLTGIFNDKISRIKIFSHKETPSLGDRIEEESFYGQYTDKSVDKDLVLTKTKASDDEIQAITQSTISSRAVNMAVNSALEAYRELEKEGGK